MGILDSLSQPQLQRMPQSDRPLTQQLNQRFADVWKRSARWTAIARLPLLILLILCILLFGWQLGGYSLFSITESKQAEIARQILVRQDWITPIYNNEGIYFDKPILLHWLMAIGYQLIGINEWAARLPSALSGAGLILLTWLFVRRFASEQVALMSATFLAANPLTFALARVGQHDMLMTVFLTAALYAWFWGYSTGRRWGYLAFAALLGLAVMSKGPLALALAGLVLIPFGLWLWLGRDRTFTKSWAKSRKYWLVGAGLFCAIALPWYIAIIAVNGQEFLQQAFLYNNLDRFLEPNQNQAGAWWYYIPVTLIGFFPWIVPLLIQLFTQLSKQLFSQTHHQPSTPRSAQNPDQTSLHNSKPSAQPPQATNLTFSWWQPTYWRNQPPTQQLTLFMALWFVAITLFMTVAATKLPWYTYPGFPALAYLCATAWDRQIQRPTRGLRWGLGLVAGLYGLIAIAFFLSPQYIPEPMIQTLVQTQGWHWILASIYGVGAVAIAICVVNCRLLWIWPISVLIFCGVALTATQSVLPQLDPLVLDGQLRPVAQVLHQETCDTCDETVIAFGINEPSLNFYSRLSEIKRPQTLADLTNQLQIHADQPILFVVRNQVLTNQLSAQAASDSVDSEPLRFDPLADLDGYERLYESESITLYRIP